jgi:leader peptidase (prepilin peptidase)/N-methyltransferase
VVVAAGLAAATLTRYGLSANGFAWSAVQVVLVGIAGYDVATRRIPNVVTVPVALGAVLLRAAFVRSSLAEVVVAGVAAFAVFFVLAMVLRGGIGMGDVKLAGMLGFLLGRAVFGALAIGILTGGLFAAVVLARSRSRRATMAYGPYLCFGGAVAIIAFHVPRLL